MKIVFLVLIFLIQYCSFSQKKFNWGIENRIKIGFLAAHHQSMAQLPRSHAFANELSIRFQATGSKQWHLDYKKPIFGVTYFMGTLGNKELIGNYYGVYQFIEFPFIRRKHYIFTGKLGDGLAYGMKDYDPYKNPSNNAIGSHVNALICLGLINRFEFNKHHFSIGVDLSHCSNASSKTPNLGINIPFLSLSYGYTIQNKEAEVKQADPYISKFRQVNFSIAGILSEKEIYPTEGRKYPVYGLSLIGRYLFKPKVGIEMSFDVFSKQSVLDYKKDIPKSQLDILQAGIFCGYILPLNRIHFILGMGVYVRDKFQPDDLFYHRIGVRYFFKNGIYINTVLKSHWASADYFESGIGYTFKYKK